MPTDKAKEIDDCIVTIAECLCDVESLIKCNRNAVTEDCKKITAGTYHVLAERVSNNLQKIDNLLER